MEYSRKILSYLERTSQYDTTHMMSMTDPIVISVKILRIYSGCSMEKDFTKLIYMNP